MKRRRLIAIAIALAATLIGGALLTWYVAGADRRAQEGVAPTKVFFAAADIGTGTRLGDAIANGWLITREVPANVAPLGASVDVSDVNRNYVAQAPIRAGDYVLLSRFVAPTSTTNGLTIPKGLVAMSFSVGRLEHLGGYVGPGSIVAVNSTPTDKTKPTVMLFTGIRVLAVDITTNADGTTGDPMYTVAVTRVQASQLVDALDKGGIYLALAQEESAAVN